MSLIEAKAVWKRTDCSVTWLMISYLLVVEQHRTQIVIHALLKCQQENLYHEQNVTHRSEERFSRNAETDLVCRLLLEKKNAARHNAGAAHRAHGATGATRARGRAAP